MVVFFLFYFYYHGSLFFVFFWRSGSNKKNKKRLPCEKTTMSGLPLVDLGTGFRGLNSHMLCLFICICSVFDNLCLGRHPGPNAIWSSHKPQHTRQIADSAAVDRNANIDARTKPESKCEKILEHAPGQTRK